MRSSLAIAGLSLVLLSACTPKTVAVVPVVTAPKYPDFVEPAVPPAFANTMAAANQARGWALLQAGDMKSAERELSVALKSAPAFYPAESGLGYVELARKDARAALGHFDRALERQPADRSALVGRGEANLVLNRTAEALDAFKAALAVDPSLTAIAQRVEVLQLREQQQGLTGARAAARAGRIDDAIRAYTATIAASPDSAFLYRELAAVERQGGQSMAALTHYRKAIELDPSDTASMTGAGDVLDAMGDTDGAVKAYMQALALEPSAPLEAKLESARARARIASLPAEYRAIDASPQIVRSDLAALIGVRLAPLLQPDRRRDGVLITDARNDWASSWIVTVTQAGIMDAFENHTFQPGAVVRRTDLAQAVSRLLTRIAARMPARAKAWESARLRFPDLGAGHLAYPAASAAVASGVMTTAADGSFQPSRVVSGAEAIEAIRRLEALVDLPASPRTER